MAKQSKLRQPYALYQRGDVWHVRFSFLNAQRQRIQLRETCATTDYEQAREYAEEKYSQLKRKANLQKGELAAVTIDEAFGRYFIEHGQYNSKPNDLLGRLNAIKKDIGVVMLHEIDSDSLSRYIAIRRKKVKASTINRMLTDINSILNRARKVWKYKTSDVVIADLKLKEDPVKTNYAKDRETLDIIINEAPAHIKLFIQIVAYTGFRKQNALQLRWDNIDFANDIITVVAKGNKLHTIPLHPKLREILDNVERINEYVVNFDGHPVKSIDTAWRKMFDRLKTKYNIPYLRRHDIRHTFASWIYKNTKDIKVVKELLGHSSLRMTDRYTHISDEEKINAIETL